MSHSEPQRRSMFPRLPAGMMRRCVTGAFWIDVGSLVLLWVWPGMERVFRTGGTLLLGGLALLLGAFWFLFLSDFSKRLKIRVTAGLLCLGLAGGMTFRVKEFSGDIIPVLTWRWTPVQDRTLQGLEQDQVAAHALRFPKSVQPTDSPRFLGQEGRGEVKGLRLETDWEKHPPRKVWRKAVGAGWSGFAVVGDFGVTQEQRGNHECVTCYDLKTGEILWSHQDLIRFSEALGGDGPRATPTVVEGRVYTLGATGILNCLEGASGKLLWSKETLKDLNQLNLEWGKSASPLVIGNEVIVSLGRPTAEVSRMFPSLADGLAAFDRNSGKLVWKAGEDYSAYSSPVVATLGGTPQILSLNAQSISAHDPRTGWILWSHRWPGTHPKCSNPFVIDGDRILLSAGYGLGGVLLKVSKAKAGSQWIVDEVWKSRQLKTRFTNIVLHDKFLYGLDDGILCCVEMETGKTRWRKGRYSHGQILLVEDTLLIQAENGDLALVKADPQAYRELAHMPALNGKTWNNPTLAGNRLLVRNAEEAICYELALRSETN